MINNSIYEIKKSKYGIMTSTATVRTLQVLEYFMSAGPGPIKQVDVARACDISAGTLNRILKTLSEWGYLFRTSEKYCVRNFRLERNVPLSETYLQYLDTAIQSLAEKTGASAEIVVVAGHELLWHSRTPFPDEDVIIRANVGFRRSLYELDALARLYVSRMSWEEISSYFFTDGFYATEFEGKRELILISESRAKEMIDECRDSDFAYDLSGNHVGIRRFATVIESPEGEFLHLLSLAEPASKLRISADYVSKMQSELFAAREELMTLVSEEKSIFRNPPKHYIQPGRGG